MNHYTIDGETLDSVDLKCLLVSRGVRVDAAVYRAFSRAYRLDVSPLTCNCVLLSDGTIVQMTDMKFHLRYLNGALSWDNLKLLRYASELGTPFSVRLLEGRPAIYHRNDLVDLVSFPDYTDFYRQKTSGGLPFVG
ncbi:MAG: hypothetical protein LBT36_00545, partial [Oscillospiraceae bacterium]|nr:hypothetical protein [Oscillospiraceae bacterium]